MPASVQQEVASNVRWQGPFEDLEPLMRLYFKRLGLIAWNYTELGGYFIAAFRDPSDIPADWHIERDEDQAVSNIAAMVADNYRGKGREGFFAQSMDLGEERYVAYMTV